MALPHSVFRSDSLGAVDDVVYGLCDRDAAGLIACLLLVVMVG